jgi:hypothetical protein
MTSKRDDTKRKNLVGINILFFGFQLIGVLLIVQTIKYLILDAPSERIAELDDDWPIVLGCVVLIGVGRWGSVIYKKKLEKFDDQENLEIK